jgi:thymidylate synthase ThyX
MSFSCRVLADSVAHFLHRLTTFEVTFPRIILAEFNTHRMLSRNSASSRAIPIEKMLKMVQEDPYVPTHWGQNQKGMSATQELTAKEQDQARHMWLDARDESVEQVMRLQKIGLHKQLTNRLLEPFLWHTVIVTATEWSNYFHLRHNASAHPEINRIAGMMLTEYQKSTPKDLGEGEWHLPLILPDELAQLEQTLPAAREKVLEELVQISCARCGRVSYLTHTGERDRREDLALYGRLLDPGHMSPFEHAARPMAQEELRYFKREDCAWDEKHQTWKWLGTYSYFLGNFNGWVQHRKMIPGEEDILGFREKEQAHG